MTLYDEDIIACETIITLFKEDIIACADYYNIMDIGKEMFLSTLIGRDIIS